MFKLFSKRKRKWPEGSPFPHLTAGQVKQLKDLRDSEDFDIWLQILETTAESRASRLLAQLTPEQYNFERGVLFGYMEMHGAVERILNRAKELEQHVRRDEPADSSLHWGSPNFTDFWGLP